MYIRVKRSYIRKKRVRYAAKRKVRGGNVLLNEIAFVLTHENARENKLYITITTILLYTIIQLRTIQ